MSVLTPKQQQIQDREERILEISRRAVLADGYHGLNMDRIADEIGTSKGTIYNHFSCKEEIIIALALQTMKKRVQLFQGAAQFRGPSRHRMFSVGRTNGFFFHQYPDYFRFEQMLRIESIWEKTSEERRNLIKNCEMNCMAVVSGIVRDAIASEDLTLGEDVTPEDLVFGLWSISLGAQSIIASGSSLLELGVKNPDEMLMTHIHQLLDSYDWKPLSTEFDYSSLESRIDSEVLQQS